MNDDLKAEIANARATHATARNALSELCRGDRPLMSIPARPERDADLLMSDAIELVPRLRAALELAIEQRDLAAMRDWDGYTAYSVRSSEFNAAILARLRGEA